MEISKFTLVVIQGRGTGVFSNVYLNAEDLVGIYIENKPNRIKKSPTRLTNIAFIADLFA